MRKRTFSFLLLLCQFAISLPGNSQSNYAVLAGTIYDPQQRAIVGAMSL